MEMQPPYVPKIKIKDEEYTKIPYLMYLKNTEKEKEKEKDKEKMSVDKKLQKQYDDWFKKFQNIILDKLNNDNSINIFINNICNYNLKKNCDLSKISSC